MVLGTQLKALPDLFNKMCPACKSILKHKTRSQLIYLIVILPFWDWGSTSCTFEHSRNSCRKFCRLRVKREKNIEPLIKNISGWILTYIFYLVLLLRLDFYLPGWGSRQRASPDLRSSRALRPRRWRPCSRFPVSACNQFRPFSSRPPRKRKERLQTGFMTTSIVMVLNLTCQSQFMHCGGLLKNVNRSNKPK